MPWQETGPMEQRAKFVLACEAEPTSHAAQCRRFGISRRTGYKWWQRYLADGLAGLSDRSRARHTQAHQVSGALAERLLSVKAAHPDWGPRKVRDWLRLRVSADQVPAASTIGELFQRHGLVKSRRRRRRAPPYTQPFLDCCEPNAVWSADFKGQFRLGNGRWCYPFTVTDNYSRYLLACQGGYGTDRLGVQRCLDRTFREHGLPCAIRTDNGIPFATNGLTGLSRLGIWLLRLGVMPERILPARPDQNGRHERMHGSLKAGLAHASVKRDLAAQQRWFNRYRHEFNTERPHEALGGEPPAWHHRASKRPYDGTVPAIEHPDGAEIRRVRSTGEIKWQGELVFLSIALIGESVALTQTDEHLWRVDFGPMMLAFWDTISKRIIRPEKR